MLTKSETTASSCHPSKTQLQRTFGFWKAECCLFKSSNSTQKNPRAYKIKNFPQNQNHGPKSSRLARASKRFHKPTKSGTFHTIRTMAPKSQNNRKSVTARKIRNLDSSLSKTIPKASPLQNQKHTGSLKKPPKYLSQKKGLFGTLAFLVLYGVFLFPLLLVQCDRPPAGLAGPPAGHGRLCPGRFLENKQFDLRISCVASKVWARICTHL